MGGLDPYAAAAATSTAPFTVIHTDDNVNALTIVHTDDNALTIIHTDDNALTIIHTDDTY